MVILGISSLFHDSAAALIKDGQILAAAQEERFSRKKHDHVFPVQSIEYCLEQAQLSLSDIDIVCFYEKPFVKFERIIETYISYAPFHGFRSFIKSIPSWLHFKLNLKSYIRKTLNSFFNEALSEKCKVLFSSHHLSHAGSAYFASPYTSAAILCVDGVGEWETTSTWQASKNKITPIANINFPHSLGLFYSSFTSYCGFKVNSGEYKLMGLAPYGQPIFTDLIKSHIIHIQEDGSFKLNMNYFCFATETHMFNELFEEIFGAKARRPETAILQHYKDIAASVQAVLEEVLLKLAKHLYQTTGEDNLCLAGGVALNCVANTRLLNESGFKSIWVQPAAGDAGGALGAALNVWHMYLGQEKKSEDQMQGSYLGPEYSDDQVLLTLKLEKANFEKLSEPVLLERLAKDLSQGKTVGWFQGRMEYGPRALGHRSILADPRDADMQKKLNLDIKFRESFRPFAPVTLDAEQQKSFSLKTNSPYMLFTSPVRGNHLPAVTHIDGSARLQTVSAKSNPKLFSLIFAFQQLTSCSTLINTSFNVRGEPIVRSPDEAYHCFMNSGLDVLVIHNYYLLKAWQTGSTQIKREFEKD